MAEPSARVTVGIGARATISGVEDGRERSGTRLACAAENKKTWLWWWERRLKSSWVVVFERFW
jgi:hypothetical protein